MTDIVCDSSLNFGDVPEGRKKSMVLPVTIHHGGATTNRTVTVTLSNGEFSLEPGIGGWVAGVGTLTKEITLTGTPLLLKVGVSLSSGAGRLLPVETITIQIDGGVPVKTVTLNARVILPQPIRLVLALDRSGSMGLPLVTSRSQRMRQAARALIDLMNNDDHLGLLSFNGVAATMFDLALLSSARRSEIGAILNNPAASSLLTTGSCSLLAAVQAANTMVTQGGGSGSALFLSAGLDYVSGSAPLPSTCPRFALGIAHGHSLPENNDARLSLERVAGAGKFLLWRDAAITFSVEKYLTQTLLGIVGGGIVLDPDGVLTAGGVDAYEFDVTEADHQFDVIAFTESPGLIEMEISSAPDPADTEDQRQTEPLPFADPTQTRGKQPAENPRSGKCHEPGQEGKSDRVGPLRRGERVVVQRIESLRDGDERPKRFQVKLTAPRLDKERGVPYTFLVTTQSDLKLDAELHSSDLYVGAELLFSAVLTQFNQFLRDGVRVDVALSLPDGDTQTYPLVQNQPGRFTLRLPTFRPGLYEARFIAQGRSLFGVPFRREWLATELILAASSRLDPIECTTTPAPARDREDR